uniref:DUF8039 domain-containing protein n=1 Tax=Setaria viridis TaxID=4556 RepID=A0A4U6UC80_SETVI|nr:hypothetical protein SEVIR_5G111200v2 [Setaria viridis]
MWKFLKQTFSFPRSKELRKRIKHYARKQLGESFRRWRGELNDKYVKKGLTPFNEYGSITPAQWDEFVAEKIFDLSERQRKGELVPNRDKDVLNLTLGMKEHGCVRGVSSKLTIKDGFERDRASYKSHSHYKDDLRETAEKALESSFKDFLLATLAEYTPCSLHVPIGRAGKTKEVAKGLAIPIGGLFEGKPILHHYAYVTMLEINSNYDDHKIDIPTVEGIHCLGQSIGNTILWHKRDIILSSVPSEHALVDSTLPSPAPPAAASEEQRVATPPDAASEEQQVATPPASPAAASEPVDWPEDHPPPAQASPQQKQVDLPEEPQQQQVDPPEEPQQQ